MDEQQQPHQLPRRGTLSLFGMLKKVVFGLVVIYLLRSLDLIDQAGMNLKMLIIAQLLHYMLDVNDEHLEEAGPRLLHAVRPQLSLEERINSYAELITFFRSPNTVREGYARGVITGAAVIAFVNQMLGLLLDIQIPRNEQMRLLLIAISLSMGQGLINQYREERNFYDRHGY